MGKGAYHSYPCIIFFILICWCFSNIVKLSIFSYIL
nr:MAG TPA: hypothetical protein [Caudoviricetes sp.]